MNFPETSIIGTGGLGTVLTQTLLAKKIPVKSVFNRTPKKAEELADTNEIEIWGSFPSALDDLGKLVFITVSDDEIEKVARRLSQLSDNIEERIFIHCSGNGGADLLQSLKSKGSSVASFHPLQTFTSRAKPEDFKGIYFSIQGDREVFPLLQELAQQLGAEAFEVTKEQKSHLHAAAVMASNYLTALLDASVEIGTASGLSDEKVKKALLPLIRTTLRNTEHHSLSEALTGPIKRGDIITIKKHLSLLEEQSELRDLYCLLGLQAVRLAELSGHLDGTVIEKMCNILLEQFKL